LLRALPLQRAKLQNELSMLHIIEDLQKSIMTPLELSLIQSYGSIYMALWNNCSYEGTGYSDHD